MKQAEQNDDDGDWWSLVEMIQQEHFINYFRPKYQSRIKGRTLSKYITPRYGRQTHINQNITSFLQLETLRVYFILKAFLPAVTSKQLKPEK